MIIEATVGQVVDLNYSYNGGANDAVTYQLARFHPAATLNTTNGRVTATDPAVVIVDIKSMLGEVIDTVTIKFRTVEEVSVRENLRTTEVQVASGYGRNGCLRRRVASAGVVEVRFPFLRRHG